MHFTTLKFTKMRLRPEEFTRHLAGFKGPLCGGNGGKEGKEGYGMSKMGGG